MAEYYLHHRYSEDLDLFSDKEIDPFAIQVILKKTQKLSKFTKIDYQQSFNRNLFFLQFDDNEIIKTEFTYYPFPQINEPKIIEGIKVDSLLDIAVNKSFTIYQKPKSRDFIDLYLILKTQKWSFKDLLKKARIKFDMHIDPLQLAQQLLLINQVKDYPRMLINLQHKEVENFWLNEAAKLKKEAIK